MSHGSASPDVIDALADYEVLDDGDDDPGVVGQVDRLIVGPAALAVDAGSAPGT